MRQLLLYFVFCYTSLSLKADQVSELMLERAYVKSQLEKVGYMRWRNFATEYYNQLLELQKLKVKEVQKQTKLTELRHTSGWLMELNKEELQKLALKDEKKAKELSNEYITAKSERDGLEQVLIQDQESYKILIEEQTKLVEKLKKQVDIENKNMQQSKEVVNKLLAKYKSLDAKVKKLQEKDTSKNQLHRSE